MRLSEIGEFGFIDTVKEKCPVRPDVLIGIGDDAAATTITPGMILLTTADMLAEGVHFDLAWSDPYSLGRKSLAVNLSDIAAMGGIARHALLSLAIPPELPFEFLNRFMEGFLEQAEQSGVVLIGGDTSASRSGLVISVSLLGEQYPDRVVRRDGARSGDLLCVSGTLGDSALGLDLLKGGCRSGYAVQRHIDPRPQVVLGKLLAENRIPSAMIDISDGLVADLGHILALSSQGARVDIDALPRSDFFRSSVERTAPDFYRLPLSGGEDYELLFALPAARLQAAEHAASGAGTTIAVIGEITGGTELLLIDSAGASYTAATSGYDHFAVE